MRAGLKFDVAPDYESLSQRAAALIEESIHQRPDLLLCAAAGASPRRTYALLVEQARRDPSRFKPLRVIKVDEWGGLNRNDPATCEADLLSHLVVPLGITPDRYQGFVSDPAVPQTECERVAQWLADNGPIDVCVLGVGTNGHIAMNEPADELCPGVHVAQLAPSSLMHPMLAASSKTPTFGLTLGVGDILRSRKILVLVSGEQKRAVLTRLREPLVTPRFPVSLLWLHPEVTVLCDQAAAGGA